MFAVAHRSQMRGTTSKPLFASIQAAREQVPPQAHAALAATVKTRVAFARVFGCALQTSQQAVVSTFQSTSHIEIPHSELPQCARGFLAKDVACGCRRDALTRKQDNALGTFGGKSGECTSVGPGQPLASDNPPCGLTAFSRRERTAGKLRGIDGVNGLRKTGPVDQHTHHHPEGVGRLPPGPVAWGDELRRFVPVRVLLQATRGLKPPLYGAATPYAAATICTAMIFTIVPTPGKTMA
jgi:hypothetical protein